VRRLSVQAVVLSLVIFAAGPALPRNVKLILPIAAATQAITGEDRPTGAVKFFFGDENTPEIVAEFGTHAVTPRTSAMGTSDEKACYGAFQWTLVNLEKRAQRLGANAVINIVSFYKKNELSSTTEFECHVGDVIASVFLRGKFVRIADR